MYQRILVPVDNSKYSDEGVRVAASWAERLGATITGFHVYAAGLHETRFQQMESGLPSHYQAPDKLQHQRSVHETLISEGLRLISESYLNHAEEICRELEVRFEHRLAEGRNYVEILREIERDGYDLVALGHLGLGASQRSLIGGVSERVLRRCSLDVLLVRKSLPESSGIMVAIDGSSNSFTALNAALRLSMALEQPVEAVSVFDPQFHIEAFRRIGDVISKEAGELFRLQEQRLLHEEIIDKGLERLYLGYLENAVRMAEVLGKQIRTSLLEGKPFEQILRHANDQKPSLLIVGRFGQHRTEYADMGNTSENLARLAGCSVLIVGGESTATEDQKLKDRQVSAEIM